MVDKPIFEIGATEGPGIPDNLKKPTLGLFLCGGPTKRPGEEENANQTVEINFTGKPGEASTLYYSLFFQLPKWGWFVAKADEWIEVSPTHKEYYERTMATKQMLESTIKTGLTSAAQAVADFELMSHDLRKYKEILGYFSRKDEHVLKAMFVDQVDVHTDLPGTPISMRSTASRWPTIIADFMSLSDDDTAIEKVTKKLNVSNAEAVILVTKNKLYKEWKNYFKTAAKDRYGLIKGLVISRKKSIEEYREWLKPYIARFKMTKLGGERIMSRASTLKSFADLTGMSTFANDLRVFTWRPLKTVEPRRPAAEMKENFVIYPYDDYIRENYVLNPSKGLAALYPWLNDDKKYCPKCKAYFPSGLIVCEKCGSTNLLDKKLADQIVEEEILPAWKSKEMNLDPFELYYMFLDFDIFRVGTRLPTGELESITFTMKNFVVSQNVLLVKILELKCRDLELERYIDQILGVRMEDKEISEIMVEEFPGLYPPKKISGYKLYVKGLRESFQTYGSFLGKIKTPKFKNLMFVKPGHYERDFKERISKHYSGTASLYFNAVVDFIKDKMGVE